METGSEVRCGLFSKDSNMKNTMHKACERQASMDEYRGVLCRIELWRPGYRNVFNKFQRGPEL